FESKASSTHWHFLVHPSQVLKLVVTGSSRQEITMTSRSTGGTEPGRPTAPLPVHPPTTSPKRATGISKEAESKKIVLQEDGPDMVERMLFYLHTRQYGDNAKPVRDSQGRARVWRRRCVRGYSG
ncbi:hypothetical protein MMC08_004468, partial [Hypocenomyce scalaris]|nr:hypothetical protein [Hypocenomyce scalaris]